MGSLQILTQERDRLFEQARKLDQAVVVLGGTSVFGAAAPSKPAKEQRAPRAPTTAAAQAKRRTRINTQMVDHYVLQALIDHDDGFMTGNQIIKAVGKAGLEINGIQMRASVKRLTDAERATDNGESRAKKAYRATVKQNDLEFDDPAANEAPEADAEESDSTEEESEDEEEEDSRQAFDEEMAEQAEEEEEAEEEEVSATRAAKKASSVHEDGDDIVGALDDKGMSGMTAKNAVVMALSIVTEGLNLDALVEKAQETFPEMFSEDALRDAVSKLAKSGDILKKKMGDASVYMLKPQAA